MHLRKTDQSEDEEGVVDPSRSFAILIGGKECQQTCHESHCDKGSFQRWEDKAGYTREDNKGRSDSPAINTDKGIEIVEQYHQIGGQGVTHQLYPPLVLNDAANQAEPQSIENRQR